MSIKYDEAKAAFKGKSHLVAQALALQMLSEIMKSSSYVGDGAAQDKMSDLDDVLLALDESGMWPDPLHTYTVEREAVPFKPGKHPPPLDPDTAYVMVAYGGLGEGHTFFGPFVQKQAEAFCEHISGTGFDSAIIPLTEARVMNRMHGFFPCGRFGFVVDPLIPGAMESLAPIAPNGKETK